MKKDTAEKKSGILRFYDLFPELLFLLWRIPFIAMNMKKMLGYNDDDILSVGTIMEKNARKHPNNPAVLYEDITISHLEFNKAINRFANYLISKGLKKGDVAIVMVDNRPELLMIIAAMAKIGGIASLINPNLRGEVLAYSIDLTRHKTFIIGEELLEAFEEVKPDLKLNDEDLLCYLADKQMIPVPTGYVDLDGELVKASEENPATVASVKLKDPFAYVFTSGTTGLPKASIQPQRRWFAGGIWFGKIVMNHKVNDIHYVTLPFCHTNGLHVSWGACANCGAAVAIGRRFSASNFWNDVRKFKASSFMYIGEVCRYLMNQPPSPDDKNHQIKKIVGNGLRPEIWNDFKKRFNIGKVYELFGAAEAPLIFTNILNVDRTVGICLTKYAIVKYDVDDEQPVLDKNGFMIEVEPGESGLTIGEISEKSLPFYGYTDEKQTENKVFRNVFTKNDAWFNTGDLLMNLGYRHARFVDRLGDTFRWKGENVSTMEVEKIVNTVPQVAESSAYGILIPGTEGRAGMVSIVPLNDQKGVDLAACAEIVNMRLPSYAVPIFIRFVKELKKTATLKIKKGDLKSEGFNPDLVNDPLYVMLPGEKVYQHLTPEVHRGIVDSEYRF